MTTKFIACLVCLFDQGYVCLIDCLIDLSIDKHDIEKRLALMFMTKWVYNNFPYMK